MKHTVISRTVSALALAAIMAGQAAHAQNWSAIDLGASTASALNAAGQVVGSYTTASGATHAFTTGAAGAGFFDLGTLGGTASTALAINNAGQIVGWSDTSGGTRSAFVATSSAGSMTTVGSFGNANSYATSVNNQGEVLIDYNGTSGQGAVVVTLSTSAVKNVTPYGYSGHYLVPQPGYATSLNDLGTVVGQKTESCNCTANAYVFQGPGSFPSAVMLGNVMDSVANDVNNRNEAVGSVDVSAPAGTFPYAYYRAGYAALSSSGATAFQDMGTLGGLSSYAFAINNLGQIVGSAATADGALHAFLTTGPGGTNMLDLNALVTLGDGAYLTSAKDVNDLGQIVALGSNGHSYLLSAVPEPSTYALGLLGGLGLVFGKRRRRNAK